MPAAALVTEKRCGGGEMAGSSPGARPYMSLALALLAAGCWPHWLLGWLP
jgi:hypothetical protein